jgi:outer membrane protein assembly factor BamB
MNEQIILLGLKNRVAAISTADGRELWSTEISGGWGSSGFVTLVCDGSRVFACASGRLHGLDLATGHVLWTNDLPGYGYGLASLCLPHDASAPDAAVAAQHFAGQTANSSGTTAVG